MNARFSLSKHPWLFTLVFILTWVILNIMIAVPMIVILKWPLDAPALGFWATSATHLLMIFIVVPFVLGFPGRSHTFTDYLAEIRLSKYQPLLGLILLGVTCYLLLALSQAAGVLVYRLAEGLPVDMHFMRSAFVLANELPPRSLSWFISLPSIIEEVAFRGVILALFLRFYDQPKSILFSALGFGIWHIFSVFTGKELVWVAGQVVWAVVLGLFYGYVTLKTGSLLPAMLVHYLGNLLVGAVNAYLQNHAGVMVQAVYGVVFTLGIIPTGLMILWTRLFTTWWSMSTVK